MKEYIATFYSHYGAIQFHRTCRTMGLEAVIMPVPRNLSSSCGTCVKFWAEDTVPGYTEETEQLVITEKNKYICIYHAED